MATSPAQRAGWFMLCSSLPSGLPGPGTLPLCASVSADLCALQMTMRSRGWSQATADAETLA